MKGGGTDILARTIYGEARGEYAHKDGGIASLIAVGNVVMNRLKAQSGYGRTLEEVCLKPWQFSCWNETDPNRRLLAEIDVRDTIFPVCQEVAAKVVKGEWPDLTRGSDHYHALTLPVRPDWARGRQPRIRFARHVFYRLKKED